MAGLSHLKDVYDKQGKDFLNRLLNKNSIINEKMDGAFFGAKRDESGDKFRFFKKNCELTYVDRVLSKYFEPALHHFENLSPEVIKQIPVNYLFGMEYFSDKKPQTITYDRIPKNHLILSYIHIQNKAGETTETIQSKVELDKWANILGIEPPPIIFQGKLSSQQREQIQDFVYTPFEELVDKFKTTSFTRYIMSILNPNMSSTFLRDSLDQAIEGIVFRFYDDNKDPGDSLFLAKLVDPVFQARAKEKASIQNQKKSDDYIWIIVIDLMNFIEQYSISELRAIKINGETYEHRYVSLVNQIYLDFVKEFGEKYRDLDIQIPEFLQREDFGVNTRLINNKRVERTIESNPNFREIYRVFINIFRKKKIRVSSTFFTKEMKNNLNSQVDKISKVIMGDSLFENYFPTFNEFIGEEKEPGYFETFKDLQDRKSKPVNLIISDFQPIHQGHIKAAQKLFDDNGLPTLFVCIHNGSTSKSRPFKLETLANSLHKLATNHPSFIAGHIIVPDGDVENLLKVIKPDYEPAIVASSKSRIRDLALQLELAKKRSRNLNLRKDLRLIELPTAGIKDAIMASVQNNDYSGFKSAVPHEIHSEFFNMNRDLTEKLNESSDLSKIKSLEVPVIDVDESELVLEEVINESPESVVSTILSVNEDINSYVGSYEMTPGQVLKTVEDLGAIGIDVNYIPEKHFAEIITDNHSTPYNIILNNGGKKIWSFPEENCVLIKTKSQ